MSMPATDGKIQTNLCEEMVLKAKQIECNSLNHTQSLRLNKSLRFTTVQNSKDSLLSS